MVNINYPVFSLRYLIMIERNDILNYWKKTAQNKEEISSCIQGELE
jgi:hypothetical protein